MRMVLALLLMGCAETPAADPGQAEPETGVHATPVTVQMACKSLAGSTCYHLSECSLDAAGRDAGRRDLNPSFNWQACTDARTAACCEGADCSATYGTVADVVACIQAQDALTCSMVTADGYPPPCSF